MINKQFRILATIGSTLCLCTSLVEAQSINVTLDRNSTSAQLTIGTSALGYDAADTFDSGTTWNNVYFEGGSGSTSLGAIVPASSAVGAYPILNNISLLYSAGVASGASLSAVINVGSVNSHAEFNNGTPGGTPSGLMGQSARLYNGSDTVTWTITGLTADAQYNLYLYAVGGGTGQGASFSLSSTYQAPTGLFSAQTTAYSATSYNAIWDSNGNVINGPGSDDNLYPGNDAYASTWIELNGETDSSGDLIFTEAKNYTGVDYFDGFQIQAAVPEPSTFALAGLGLIGFIVMNYRRRCMCR
jgi:hypothetical protein